MNPFWPEDEQSSWSPDFSTPRRKSPQDLAPSSDGFCPAQQSDHFDPPQFGNSTGFFPSINPEFVCPFTQASSFHSYPILDLDAPIFPPSTSAPSLVDVSAAKIVHGSNISVSSLDSLSSTCLLDAPCYPSTSAALAVFGMTPPSKYDAAFPVGPDLISTLDYTFNTLPSNTAASSPPPSSPNLKDSSNITITRASSSASILSKSPRCNSSQLTATPSVTTASSFISNKRKRLTTTANDHSPSHNDDVDANVERAEKRQRNNAAARKYRQKFVERIAELEKALAEVSAERDQLKLKLVRSEAEVEVLRGFVEKSRK